MKISKEIIFYLIFGVLTTAVNFVSFYIFDLLGLATAISTVIAWLLSVLFAFFTNKKFVFESREKSLIKELASFFSCRIFTGILDLGIMVLFVDLLHFNSLIIKVASNIIVIILNYIFSKFFIFKKGENNESDV